MVKIEYENQTLKKEEIESLIEKSISEYNLTNKKILVIIPDYTRTAPISLFFELFYKHLLPKNKSLDYLIALGTHPPMSEQKINELLDVTQEEREQKYKAIKIYNHYWQDPNCLTNIGTISQKEIEILSNGLMNEEVPVLINKLILNYDQIIIVGPTFPHEVVGFSGGNKYFFPGISGAEITNFFHWLGALITNPQINGVKDTPVRRVVDKASSFIKIPKLCFSLVVTHKGLHGVFVDTPEKSYDLAADLSNKLHIIYVDKPYKQVLSMAPLMYDELWTAGKCMYKLEPVVADGGDLIIYAPFLNEISITHGKIIEQIGYHTRDYFLKQMDKFKNIPKGVMAHSTHVKGIGNFENGIEKPRINVILATQISENVCQKINLGYKNPDEINPAEWEKEKDCLVVHKAGEMLYKIKK